jgi:hypothetical protein
MRLHDQIEISCHTILHSTRDQFKVVYRSCTRVQDYIVTNAFVYVEEIQLSHMGLRQTLLLGTSIWSVKIKDKNAVFEQKRQRGDIARCNYNNPNCCPGRRCKKDLSHHHRRESCVKDYTTYYTPNEGRDTLECKKTEKVKNILAKTRYQARIVV